MFFTDFILFFRLVQAQFEDPQSQQAGHGSSHGLQGRRPGGRGAGKRVRGREQRRGHRVHQEDAPNQQLEEEDQHRASEESGRRPGRSGVRDRLDFILFVLTFFLYLTCYVFFEIFVTVHRGVFQTKKICDTWLGGVGGQKGTQTHNCK